MNYIHLIILINILANELKEKINSSLISKDGRITRLFFCWFEEMLSHWKKYLFNNLSRYLIITQRPLSLTRRGSSNQAVVSPYHILEAWSSRRSIELFRWGHFMKSYPSLNKWTARYISSCINQWIIVLKITGGKRR